MPIAKVFHNHVKNCQVSHPDGRVTTFNNGKHITTIEKDIEYLQSLVDANDDFVFVDPECLEVDTEELTPAGIINKLKREAVEEFLAAQAAASATESTSDQGRFNPGTSATLVNAVGSNGQKAVAPTASLEAVVPSTVERTSATVSPKS